MIKDHLERILNGEDLTREEASADMDVIISGKAFPFQIAGLIVALKQKGETVDEAAGVTVVKHGNRSISSRLLVATGGNIDPGTEVVSGA